jgi:hypothetical protein
MGILLSMLQQDFGLECFLELLDHLEQWLLTVLLVARNIFYAVI